MEVEGKPAGLALEDLVFECLLAAAALSRWTLFVKQPPGDAGQRALSFVFVPAAGFAIGVLLVLMDRALAGALSPVARSLAVLLIGVALTGGIDLFGIADTVEAIRAGAGSPPVGATHRGPLGGAAALGWFAARVSLFSCIQDVSGRSAALVMATMLSRWSIVPIGYGLKPLEPRGLGLPYEGGIKFREFSLSSIIALGIALGMYENLGLAAVVAVAAVTLGVRVVLSRRLGGAAGYTLAGGAAICDLATFALLAGLGI